MSTLPTPRTDAAAILCCHVVACPLEVARQLERELAEAKAERDALKAEVERLLIQNRSQQELGDAIVECASRSLGVIRKDTTVFGEYSHRSCVEISLRNLEEMGREIIDPGVSKWGRKDAQDVHRNTHAQFVRCEADLSRWRALAEELAGALEAAIDTRAATAEWVTDKATMERPERWIRDPWCQEWRTKLARFRDAANPASARTPKEEAP